MSETRDQNMMMLEAEVESLKAERDEYKSQLESLCRIHDAGRDDNIWADTLKKFFEHYDLIHEFKGINAREAERNGLRGQIGRMAIDNTCMKIKNAALREKLKIATDKLKDVSAMLDGPGRADPEAWRDQCVVEIDEALQKLKSHD